MSTWLREIRRLRHQPLGIAVGTLILGLGIATTLAALSLVDGLFFRRPAAVGDPLSLVDVRRPAPAGATALQPTFITYPEYLALAQESQLFDRVSVVRPIPAVVRADSHAERIQLGLVDTGYFDTLATRAIAGRTFEAADAHAPVAVVSERLAERLGEAVSLGRAVVVNGEAVNVIGVLPAGFRGLHADTVEMWTPIALMERLWTSVPVDRRKELWTAPRVAWCTAIARLKPGVTPSAVNARFRTPSARLADAGELRASTAVDPQQITSSRVLVAWWIFVAVSLMLLAVACVNVSGICASRYWARRHEIATVIALGGGRRQLHHSAAAEGLLIAAGAGAVGALGAGLVLAIMAAAAPPSLQWLIGPSTTSADWRLAGVSFGLAALVGMGSTFAGMAGVRRFATPDLLREQQSAARSGTAGRLGLLAGQVALAVALLTVAGVLWRTTQHFAAVETGVSLDRLYVGTISFQERGYTAERAEAFSRALHGRLTNEPAIVSAALSRLPPLSLHGSSIRMTVDGRGEDPRRGRSVSYNLVGPNYFDLFGIRLIDGRAIVVVDTAAAPPVIVVNETMARQWFPGDSAIGKRLWLMNESAPRTIVGVSADVKDRGIMRESAPYAYLPLFQPGPKSDAELTIAVRPRISGAKALVALRGAVHAIDQDQAVYDVRPAMAQLNRQIADQRFLLFLSTIYSALTLLIALAGLFALLSNYVMDRRREIGVRLALGASSAAVVRHVCRPAFAVISVGAGLGLALGALGWWMMRSRVYGLQTPDPLVVAGVCAVVIAGSAAAAYRPALRATRVDPTTLLRTP